MAEVNFPGLKVNEQNTRGKFPMKKGLPQMYYLCRVRAVQSNLFKRRGYILARRTGEGEETYQERLRMEEEWVKCSEDDSLLATKTKFMLLNHTTERTIKDFKQEYTIEIREWVTSQECARRNLKWMPIVTEDEKEIEEYRVGLFRPEEETGRHLLDETFSMFTTVSRSTTVVFSLDISASSTEVFRDTPHFFEIVLSKPPGILDRIAARNQGVELWFADELLMDPFQHWLTPHHRIITSPELLHLTSREAMVIGENAEWSVIPNSTLSGKDNLPILLETDIVARFLGANTGDVIYWENPPIIEQLSAMEFGYCRVKGHVVEINMAAAEEEEDEDLENMEEEEELESGDDDPENQEDD